MDMGELVCDCVPVGAAGEPGAPRTADGRAGMDGTGRPATTGGVATALVSTDGDGDGDGAGKAGIEVPLSSRTPLSITAVFNTPLKVDRTIAPLLHQSIKQ